MVRPIGIEQAAANLFAGSARAVFRVGTLFQVPALWPSFKDYFSTNLGLGDIIGLARFTADHDMQAVHAHVIGAKDVERVNPDNPAYIVTTKGDAVFQEIENVFVRLPSFRRPSGQVSVHRSRGGLRPISRRRRQRPHLPQDHDLYACDPSPFDAIIDHKMRIHIMRRHKV